MPEIDNNSEQWFALTVAPQHEAAVVQRLITKGINACAPVHKVRRRWSDRVKVIAAPLFPGYVFCRFVAERRGYAMNTVGVRGIVCFGGRPAPLSDCEVERIQQIATSGLHLDPLDGLCTGTRVKILSGSLTGIEGVLSEVNGSTRVVVSIEMLNRSVAVQVDADVITPAAELPQIAVPA